MRGISDQEGQGLAALNEGFGVMSSHSWAEDDAVLIEIPWANQRFLERQLLGLSGTLLYLTPLRFDAQVWSPSTKIRLFAVTQNQNFKCRDRLPRLP